MWKYILYFDILSHYWFPLFKSGPKLQGPDTVARLLVDASRFRMVFHYVDCLRPAGFLHAEPGQGVMMVGMCGES